MTIGAAQVDPPDNVADTGITKYGPEDQPDPNQLCQFEFSIKPESIIADLVNGLDAPKLDGGKLTPPDGPIVPAGEMHHPVIGPGNAAAESPGGLLKHGADKRWDVSRQMQCRILNVASAGQSPIPLQECLDGFFDLYTTQPSTDSTPVPFPVDSTIGNDDVWPNQTAPTGEDNNPYQVTVVPGLCHGIGAVTSIDGPYLTVASIGAAAGITYTEIDSFREFVRLQLVSKWFRVSDFKDWGVILKVEFDAVQNKWKDAGCLSIGEVDPPNPQ
jgi:hypothetical protein